MAGPEVEVGGAGPNTSSIECHDTRRGAERRPTPERVPSPHAGSRHRPRGHPRARAPVARPQDTAEAGRGARAGVREAKTEAVKAQAEIQARAAGEPIRPDEQAKPDGPADRSAPVHAALDRR